MTPHQLNALLKEAMAHHQAGRYPHAAARYAQLRQLAPTCFEAHFHGGQMALLQEDYAQALALFSKAAQLNPRSAEAAIALGVTRLATGDGTGAEAPLRAASLLQPGNADVWDKLALILKMQARYDEAIACHERAVKLAPKNAGYWHALGATLSHGTAYDRALECEDKAVALNPRSSAAHLGRATMLHKMHRIPEALQAYEKAVALDPKDHVARSYRLLGLNYLPGLSRERVWEEHRAYGQLVKPSAERRFSVDRDPHRRLRVGFLSPDLRSHPVAAFLEPLLRHVDQSAFEIVLFHDHPTVDETSLRLQSLASLWRNLSGRLDAVACESILADKPDILVDLAGHTGLNRMPLFAGRLAPVQVSYLGYPNTTGLEAMDYRFVDGVTDPDEKDQAFHSERLQRFSPCAWAFEPPAGAPSPGPAPRALTGQVTFGAFNNFAKVGDNTLRCWARLLERVPGSRLLLKAPGLSAGGVRAVVERRLREAGLPQSRVELLERTLSQQEHLALYNQVDVALDTWPYNGTTTTCEALWMGVPVVTLAGDRHASRVGESLLRAVGQQAWVATSEDAYVELCASLATAPASKDAVRSELREALKGSLLLDHPGQAARFFSALRQAWVAWCA